MMLRPLAPRAASKLAPRSFTPFASQTRTPAFYLYTSNRRRCYATEAREQKRSFFGSTLLIVCVAQHDLVIIGGGVAGYVAAIKAGQEGLKVDRKAAAQYKLNSP